MSSSLGRAPRLRRSHLLGLAGLTVVVAALPWVFHTPYAHSTLVLVGIYALVTLGLCLLMGYAGQVSLGQAAFFGLGAYGAGALTVKFAWSPWTALVAAAFLTALVAYAIGIPLLRLRGHYLAMGTLAFGAVAHIVMNEWKAYTGGRTGLPGIPRPVLGTWKLTGDLPYYYLVWIITLVGLWLALNIVNSRVGRALRAIRESETATESLGVPIVSLKLQILVVSSVYASIAGSLYAYYISFVSPSAFDLDTSVRLVLMAAVGGLASVWGAPFGAAAVILLTLVLREWVPLVVHRSSGEVQITAYGILLVAIMIAMPDGVVVAVQRLWRRARPLARLGALARRQARPR